MSTFAAEINEINYTIIIMNKLTSTIITLFLATATNGHAQLVVNELMQSNIDCIMDDLNDFPDSWVELYNAGTTAVNLKDYKLGTSNKANKAWQLTDKTVAPKAYALIYCDKVGEKLHTDFRLESGKGCEVYLFKGDEVVDKLPAALKKQPAPNIAYGRKTDGSDEWGYQLTPTPNAANSGDICDIKQILGEPVFSEKGRVVTGSQNLKLKLSLPEGAPEGTQIRYTVNGSEPTEGSAPYVTEINVNRSMVVRAKLFCKGWLSPRSTAQSYIALGREMTLPVISIALNDNYLNDKTIGIYANNDGNKKNDWRRPMNIEFFFGADADSKINQLCEARVAGGATRSEKLKTFAIYANKRFGTKRFNYEFFPEDKPGLTDFKSLMLRNAGNDFGGLFMRDAIIQRNAAGNIDLDWQAYRPAVLFINGTYKGMLNIRERSNEDMIYTNYDGLEDLDMFENWNELKEGTWDNFNNFKAFYNEKGHTMAEYEQWMDVEEFANLMVVNLYHTNLDFPGNNIVMWRPTAEGGRWRWVMKDTDFGLGLYGRDPNYEIFKWLYNPNFDSSNNWGANSYEGTRLFRRLMEDETFKGLFIDRCMIFTGSFLNEKGIREVWEPMLTAAKKEIVRHRELYKPDWAGWWWNAENSYNDEVNSVRNWLSKRTNLFINQLVSYYNLKSPVPLSINKGVEKAAETALTFNGIKLAKGTFDGKFFTGRAISLESSSTAVTGWKVITDGNIKEYIGTKLELEMPQCKQMSILALTGGETSIATVEVADEAAQDVYDLNGRKVRTGSTSLEGLPKGIYVIGGRKVVK